MYTQTDTPDAAVVMVGGSHMEPVATLEDEYGGRAQICVDDHCFILMLKRDNGYITTPHWFQEAVNVLKTLPSAHEIDAAVMRGH